MFSPRRRPMSTRKCASTGCCMGGRCSTVTLGSKRLPKNVSLALTPVALKRPGRPIFSNIGAQPLAPGTRAPHHEARQADRAGIRQVRGQLVEVGERRVQHASHLKQAEVWPTPLHRDRRDVQEDRPRGTRQEWACCSSSVVCPLCLRLMQRLWGRNHNRQHAQEDKRTYKPRQGRRRTYDVANGASGSFPRGPTGLLGAFGSLDFWEPSRFCDPQTPCWNGNLQILQACEARRTPGHRM